jgi:hypothetical protein
MKIHLSYQHNVATLHVWAGQTSLRPSSPSSDWRYSGVFHMHLWSDGWLTLINCKLKHSNTPAHTLKPRATLTLVMALGAALRSKAIVKQPVAPLQIVT